MHSSVFIIINPASARSRRVWPEIKNRLTESRILFDAYETTHAGDASEKTREALRAGFEIIAVVGGDGTLSEAASGFFEFQADDNPAAFHLPSAINNRAALAILPAGTGNDFARGLAKGREPLEKWLETLINHCRNDNPDNARAIDV